MLLFDESRNCNIVLVVRPVQLPLLQRMVDEGLVVFWWHANSGFVGFESSRVVVCLRKGVWLFGIVL